MTDKTMAHHKSIKFSLRLFSLLFVVISISATGQSVEAIRLKIGNIQTPPEANEFLSTHRELIGAVAKLTSGTDTTEFDQQLLSTSQGDLLEFDSEDKKKHFFFKTLSIEPVESFRVQYIFLDNRKLTLNQIDSIRAIILKRLGHGEIFSELAREYSMDGNAKNGGDIGWFLEAMMHPEFENNARNRKLNEVFTVDISENRWYYVVKKSHNSRMEKKVELLYVEITNP